MQGINPVFINPWPLLLTITAPVLHAFLHRTTGRGVLLAATLLLDQGLPMRRELLGRW